MQVDLSGGRPYPCDWKSYLIAAPAWWFFGHICGNSASPFAVPLPVSVTWIYTTTGGHTETVAEREWPPLLVNPAVSTVLSMGLGGHHLRLPP